MDLNLDKDIQREIEFNVEKEKLEEVKALINKETLKCIDKRTEFTKYILDYRKKVIEEHREDKDDEDGTIEYFDHERYMKEEAYKAIDRKLTQMTQLKPSPYFGSIDFTEDEYGKERIYIGRYGLMSEDGYEPVIIDWRAPVSALFYDGKTGKSSYNTPAGEVEVDIDLRRQFVIKKGQLEGLFSSDLDIKDEILQSVLCQNTEDKLRDIVMTIQREQDEIIRQSRRGVVVVDGVAGSGKTTIALHRIAYLLYNYRESLTDKTLILGPNLIFMDYISEVLPTLGETDINQNTFNELAKSILGIEEVMPFTEYMEKIYGEDHEFINDIAYKRSKEFIEAIEQLANKVEGDISDIGDVKLYDEVVMTKEEIDSLFNEYYKYMPCYRRIKKIRRILFDKIRNVRYEIFKGISKEFDDELSKLSEKEKILNMTDVEFRKKLKVRELIQESMKVKKSLNEIKLNDMIEIYNDFNGNKPLMQDDFAPILYLKILLEGYKYPKDIKHIVIDEAQDYSELQLIVIKQLFDCKSFTIVGDSNQKIIPTKESPVLSRVNEIYSDLKVTNFPLLKSYRSTQEIMEYANKFLKENKVVPLVRNGEPVDEIEIENFDELILHLKDKIRELQKSNYENIAILCDSLEFANELYDGIREISEVKLINSEDIIYKKGIAIMPVYYGKGLEFDSVVMIESKGHNKNKINYVKSTRALHKLVNLRIRE